MSVVAQHYRSPWMCITKSSREVCLHPSCSNEDVNYFLCYDWLGSACLPVFTHTRPQHLRRSPRAGPDVPRTMHFTSGSGSPLTLFKHVGHPLHPRPLETTDLLKCYTSTCTYFTLKIRCQNSRSALITLEDIITRDANSRLILHPHLTMY